MATIKMRLVRPKMHVQLEMTSALPLMKGTWRRLVDKSTSALASEEGEWENWILGSPGGGDNIRLYDKSGTKSALLKNYTTGNVQGLGQILFLGFGGAFGDDEFDWILA